jgi:hypothetical protein
MTEESKVFVWGFIAGVLVLGGELAFFVLNMLIAALINATAPQTSQALVTVSADILLLTITGVTINILIGYFAPKGFSLGYLTGNFMLIALLLASLSQVTPVVATGSIIAIAVLVGLGPKVIFEGKTGDISIWNNNGKTTPDIPDRITK